MRKTIPVWIARSTHDRLMSISMARGWTPINAIVEEFLAQPLSGPATGEAMRRWQEAGKPTRYGSSKKENP